MYFFIVLIDGDTPAIKEPEQGTFSKHPHLLCPVYHTVAVALWVTRKPRAAKAAASQYKLTVEAGN